MYAGRHGIIGALTEDLIDTSRSRQPPLRGSKHTRGARSARRAIG